MVNVLLVEDSQIAREAIKMQLTNSETYQVVASIENAANAEIICMRGQVDLILMDVCTADNESGLKSAERIKRNYPDIKIIIMTSVPEHSFIKKAKECGCNGFWYKEYGNTPLLHICERVMRGEYVYPELTPSVQIGNVDSRDFTERELEIIRELSLGHKYDAIAETLNISTNTVKYHIKNLMQKTGYQNAIQLIADVVDKRLILPKY